MRSVERAALERPGVEHARATSLTAEAADVTSMPALAGEVDLFARARAGSASHAAPIETGQAGSRRRRGRTICCAAWPWRASPP